MRKDSLCDGLMTASKLTNLVAYIAGYIENMRYEHSEQLHNPSKREAAHCVHDIDHLHQEQITMDELEETIREHGVESYKHVELAILEVDGNISVISGNKDLTQTHYKRKKQDKSLDLSH